MTRRADPEAMWQAQVLELARWYNWRVYHPPDNLPVRTRNGRVRKQQVAAGYPDLTLVRPPELIYVELKADKGRVSPAQREWLEALAACGVRTYVWRPSDWDQVQQVLAGHGQEAPLFRAA